MKARSALLFAGVLVTTTALPCLSVGPGGVRISTASESAVIVWNSSNKVEHFIREAQFVTNAKDFGFLVPTPAVPVLQEVSAEIFHKLAMIVSSRQGAMAASKSSALSSRSGAEVVVVSEQEVSGYRAAVLSAKDATALSKWLRDNGYPSSDRVTGWLRPYVDKGYAITAFKVAGQGRQASLKPVRMTFMTDVPFYPYREPADENARDDRSLRVFLLTDTGVSAKHGNEGWGAKEEYSGELTDSEKKEIREMLPGVGIPTNLHLTSYLDTSSPRDGSADLTFVPQDTRVATVAVLVGGVLLWAVVLGHRKRAYRGQAAP